LRGGVGGTAWVGSRHSLPGTGWPGYLANESLVDFVVVMERDAVDRYFANIQDAWNIEDDVDEFVRKTYGALESFPDGIVTFPGVARDTLGLQWRIGTSADQVYAALRSYADPRSSVVFGVASEDELWTSLILDLDDDYRITSVTTADPSLVDIQGANHQVAHTLTNWVEATGKTVSLTLVLERDVATAFLAAAPEDKSKILAASLAAGSAFLQSSRTKPSASTEARTSPTQQTRREATPAGADVGPPAVPG
jgi:hypothetical protein